MISLPEVFLLNITNFFGRLHPALVHLPIGILLICCLIHLLAVKPKYAALQAAVPVLLFWGTLSAVFSALTGYFLSLNGDYDTELVSPHQWLGIVSAISSIALYFLFRAGARRVFTKPVAALVVLLIGITGHLGGSLTHGEGFITGGLDEESKGPAIKPIANIQQAQVYQAAIQPLLETRCYSCHSASKIKGKLRLDKPELIMKGGEDGKVIVAGKADESKLLDRIMLPMEDEDHMPPKEKTQLTKTEMQLLHWWITGGADFTKTFGELPQTDEIKPMLLALETGAAPGESVVEIPTEKVKTPDDKAMLKLREAGVTVIPVAQGSNYLSVNFSAAISTADSILRLMEPLAQNIIRLNLAGTGIEDADIANIAKLTALRNLNLSNTKVSDSSMATLGKLEQLQRLNLVGTNVTAQGLQQLSGLKELRAIYLYRSKVDRAAWPGLKQYFPDVILDSGGYVVPTLAKDTTEVKF